MAEFQLERFLKITPKRRGRPDYDRREACLSGVWLHTWHMDGKLVQQVVRTKYSSVAAARRAFRDWVNALVDQSYDRIPAQTIGWSINPRGLRGYYHGDGRWGWPQKWRADIAVRVVR